MGQELQIACAPMTRKCVPLFGENRNRNDSTSHHPSLEESSEDEMEGEKEKKSPAKKVATTTASKGIERDGSRNEAVLTKDTHSPLLPPRPAPFPEKMDVTTTIIKRIAMPSKEKTEHAQKNALRCAICHEILENPKKAEEQGDVDIFGDRAYHVDCLAC